MKHGDYPKHQLHSTSSVHYNLNSVISKHCKVHSLHCYHYAVFTKCVHFILYVICMYIVQYVYTSIEYIVHILHCPYTMHGVHTIRSIPCIHSAHTPQSCPPPAWSWAPGRYSSSQSLCHVSEYI